MKFIPCANKIRQGGFMYRTSWLHPEAGFLRRQKIIRIPDCDNLFIFRSSIDTAGIVWVRSLRRYTATFDDIMADDWDYNK